MIVTPVVRRISNSSDGLVNARRVGLEGHPVDEQVLEDRLDLLHHHRLEERPAQDRAELPRLLVLRSSNSVCS